jgi:rhodanese-related sulfurtransferase
MLLTRKIVPICIRSLILVSISCYILAYATPVVPIPANIPGATTVSAEQLIDLAGRLPDLVIIDSRIREDRREGYIENSISLPDEETNCTTLSRIVPQKTTPTLFYCNGVKCGRSVRSVHIALKCGYTDVYWFRGGFEEWKDKQFLFEK